RKDGHAVLDWQQAEQEIQKEEPKPKAKTEAKPNAKDKTKPEVKDETKPEGKAESESETKVNVPSDLKPQIAKRAYELYEERGRKDGPAVQDWKKAEQEIRKSGAKTEDELETKDDDSAKVKDEPKPEVKDGPKSDPKPEAKQKIKPEINDEVKPEAKVKPKSESETLSDLTPGLVKRVHELYEKLGREDVKAVEDLEKAKKENQKDESNK
ncbi:MAG: DUF2934 domain-containing protein, partial [Ignavibacteriaceae bacterium]